VAPEVGWRRAHAKRGPIVQMGVPVAVVALRRHQSVIGVVETARAAASSGQLSCRGLLVMTGFAPFLRSRNKRSRHNAGPVHEPLPMAEIDRAAPLRFLKTAFEPEDWAAIFLKSYETNRVAQRVGPVSWVQSVRFLRWLRAMNARGYSVFVSVNAITLGRRSRTRDAIGAVRHVFLDADDDGVAVLARVADRRDLPPPSYVLHTSPNHIHLFWRVTAFDGDLVERLQKQLARELGTDPAATPITQNTRLPGFFNHKRAQPHLVTIEYRSVDVRYGPGDFPPVKEALPEPRQIEPREWREFGPPVIERAKRYVASVPPAIAGQHGDVHTFRVCCRLTRGFALDDEQALRVLAEWNARCKPPWSEAELLDKLHRAARYGREPIGGLL
jgi:RepB DNA-primase N-terminal domain